VLYAVFRIFAEQFREPDSELVLGGTMTSGQFLSLFMVAVGVGFLVAAKLLPEKVKAVE
jgi:phosphatidylglycerol:prolipoprotein diacylglycerol transferase